MDTNFCFIHANQKSCYLYLVLYFYGIQREIHLQIFLNLYAESPALTCSGCEYPFFLGIHGEEGLFQHYVTTGKRSVYHGLWINFFL